MTFLFAFWLASVPKTSSVNLKKFNSNETPQLELEIIHTLRVHRHFRILSTYNIDGVDNHQSIYELIFKVHLSLVDLGVEDLGTHALVSSGVLIDPRRCHYFELVEI